MAGHNKWSKIKRKKEVTDAKKSKIFSKYAKLIAVESKRANGDVTDPGLRAVIDKAKAESMPKDNIERAIARGTSKDADTLESIQYEFYGPGGIAFIVDTLTDNRNRTGQEIRHLVSKMGFSLGEPGSAAWAFTKEGTEYVPNSPLDLPEEHEESFDTLYDALEDHDDVQNVFTNRA